VIWSNYFRDASINTLKCGLIANALRQPDNAAPAV
jgi:hypothetical protein